MFENEENIAILITVLTSVFLIIIYVMHDKLVHQRVKLTRQQYEALTYSKIRNVYALMQKGKTPSAKTLSKYAENIETRAILFKLLDQFDKTELFPTALLTREKAAASYFANWVNDQDEIDQFPDELEYITNDKFEKTLCIFKFKVTEPHVFANKGWIYGYVGYAPMDEASYATPNFIFCNFESIVLDNYALKHLYLANFKQE